MRGAGGGSRGLAHPYPFYTPERDISVIFIRLGCVDLNANMFLVVFWSELNKLMFLGRVSAPTYGLWMGRPHSPA